MSTDPAFQELRALVALISDSLDSMEHTVCSRGQTFPSMHKPYSPESEAARSVPEGLKASSVIVAAASQLIAAVRPPAISALVTALQYHVSSSLRVAIQLQVPEILREAGPKGLNVKDIASPTKADPAKLSRILRVLATNYIFTEVSPDVFAHNLISSVLDTGKAVASVLENPIAKHDSTTGISALLEQVSDISFKASAYLPESLLDNCTRASETAEKRAFNLAFNTDDHFFNWLDLPQNAYFRRRFGMAMNGAKSADAPNAVFTGLDWGGLPAGSILVDVGGGVGSQSLALAKMYSHLRFIIQDTENMISAAGEASAWNHAIMRVPDESHTVLGRALAWSRQLWNIHDFFGPQPVKAPAVFFMRFIMHDWSDEPSVKILRRLRDAAGPETQLVIMDSIMLYACEEPPSSIPGALHPPAPAPLLPNGGYAKTIDYLKDLTMMALHDGIERTLPQFQKIVEESGWKIVKVVRDNSTSKVVAVPASDYAEGPSAPL
ncbi:hypothetical protein NM688_g3587 [Phlebia brevispora]|uniref:Uncharacterized protein n=1 Tax=Phlebia brevispora TaxID=194682 RepID=A0ACC1T5G7_9APHY|nr:hypothetical protein NM688_g3587 [Phlebia brevispora]